MVEYISETDFYEIRLASLISNVDKDVIVELYQPLIGSQATILYLNLVKQKRNEEPDDDNSYVTSQLLNMMQFSAGTLLSARHQLEAVGLLRTYEKTDVSGRHYIYVIYAPKTPKDFFDDVLFKGLLVQYIGEKEAKKLAHSYKINLQIDEDYREVSASFVDVFHPNYDDPSFKKSFGDSIVGHTVGRVKTEFKYDVFFKYIEENSQILTSSFYKKDMKEIERLAALFGLNEKQMAFIVIDEFDPNGSPHINFQRVADRASDEVKYRIHEPASNEKSNVSGDSKIAQKINLMERTSPIEWLQILQNGTKPAKSDCIIVNDLSRDYGFGCGVINVIVEWVLRKNNNILSKNYCEKIAASLARSNVTTAVDAMNQLAKSSKKKIETVSKETIVEDKPAKRKETVKEKDVSDDEINDILNMIDLKKNGGR